MLTVLISHYYRSKLDRNEYIKILADIDYWFNGLENSFLKKLIDFFNFVFNCHFYFVVSVVWNFLYSDRFHWLFNTWADILILVDSWWLSWLWKQSFSKTKKKLFIFAILFLLFFFLLANLVNYRSNMALWVSREGVKRDWCHKIYFFKEFVMTLLVWLWPTPLFHKKSKLIWFLSHLTLFL